MQLKISYQDGTRRIVNVASEFFEDSEIRERFKTIVMTPEMKAMDFALSCGSRPYEVILRDGDTVVFKNINKANKPIRKHAPEDAKEDWHGFMKRDGEPTVKEMKAARKEPFTKRWNPRLEPVPAGNKMTGWEAGLRLLLGHIK